MALLADHFHVGADLGEVEEAVEEILSADGVHDAESLGYDGCGALAVAVEDGHIAEVAPVTNGGECVVFYYFALYLCDAMVDEVDVVC